MVTGTLTTITTVMDITITRVTTTPTMPQTLMQIWSNTTSEFGKLHDTEGRQLWGLETKAEH
jgi:hypothetical protein